MLHKAKIEVIVDDLTVAKALFECLRPEVVSLSGRYYEASLRLKERKLTLTFESNSLSKLRAVLNSYLRWIRSIIELSEKISRREL